MKYVLLDNNNCENEFGLLDIILEVDMDRDKFLDIYKIYLSTCYGEDLEFIEHPTSRDFVEFLETHKIWSGEKTYGYYKHIKEGNECAIIDTSKALEFLKEDYRLKLKKERWELASEQLRSKGYINK